MPELTDVSGAHRLLPRPSVCLDGRNQALPNGTGVQNYATNLAVDLCRFGGCAGVLLDGRAGKPARGGMARYARAASPFGSRASLMAEAPEGFSGAWMARDVFRTAQIHFDIYDRLHRVRSDCLPGIMHWTYPLPLVFEGAPNIYTIHDLIPLTHPSLTGIDSRRFARIVRKIVSRADHIVTVSEASRRDIMAMLGVSPDQVTNTYQAVTLPGPANRSGASPQTGYFLFCGTLEARKNLVRLIAAYEASGSDTPLILAGPDGEGAAEMLGAAGVAIRPIDAMESAGQRGVWRAPWLERPVLLDLFRKARALLFPSLAEGFGLPIVEAMVLGVPVLTSRSGATGEIAGDAALLVDPKNIPAMATAITALDKNEDLRAALVTRGFARAANFTSEACMARLSAVYRKVGAECG